MTADPDAVTQPIAKTDAGDQARRRDDAARVARGRSAKLLPPADPAGTLARPMLEERLLRGPNGA